jgi:hypothetical protein
MTKTELVPRMRLAIVTPIALRLLERFMDLSSRRTVSLLFLGAALALLATSMPALGQDSVVFTFTSGTGDSAGSITVTNANTGSTTNTGLVPHWSPEACAQVLALAATKIGFRTELSGRSVRVLGRGAVVRAVGAVVTKSEADAGP